MADKLQNRIKEAADDIYNKSQEAYSQNKVMITGLQISTLSGMDSMMRHFKSMVFTHPSWTIKLKQQIGVLDGSGGINVSNSPKLTFYDIGDDYKNLLLAYENGYDEYGRPKNPPLSIKFDMEVYRPVVSAGKVEFRKEYSLKFTGGRITKISTRKMDTSAASSNLETYDVEAVFRKETTTK